MEFPGIPSTERAALGTKMRAHRAPRVTRLMITSRLGAGFAHFLYRDVSISIRTTVAKQFNIRVELAFYPFPAGAMKRGLA